MTKQEKIEAIREQVAVVNNLECKCLGFPLTLERVLIALQTKHEELKLKYPSYTWLDFSGHVITWYYVKNNRLYIGDLQISWIPNKTLENQSDKTIDEIYQILVIS